MNMITTNLFIVINEETLETMKDKNGETAKFNTSTDANKNAAERLEIWNVVPVHFNHRFINHTL
jgi:hypothetical protein